MLVVCVTIMVKSFLCMGKPFYVYFCHSRSLFNVLSRAWQARKQAVASSSSQLTTPLAWSFFAARVEIGKDGGMWRFWDMTEQTRDKVIASAPSLTGTWECTGGGTMRIFRKSHSQLTI